MSISSFRGVLRWCWVRMTSRGEWLNWRTTSMRPFNTTSTGTTQQWWGPIQTTKPGHKKTVILKKSLTLFFFSAWVSRSFRVFIRPRSRLQNQGRNGEVSSDVKSLLFFSNNFSFIVHNRYWKHFGLFRKRVGDTETNKIHHRFMSYLKLCFRCFTRCSWMFHWNLKVNWISFAFAISCQI